MNDSLDKDLREIEAQLTSLNPSKMPDDMIARMEQAMISWESNLPVEEKIVQFEYTNKINTPVIENSSDKMHIWGAVAAIALVASVVSVFMGSSSSQNLSIAEAPKDSIHSSSDLVSPSSSELSRNIIHASNEGVTYSDNNDEAFKVLRIEYTEKLITRDSEDNPVVIEKTCIEHVLVPVPVH